MAFTLFSFFVVCINLRISIVFGKTCMCSTTNVVCCCSLSRTENVFIACTPHNRVEILNAVNTPASRTTCYPSQLPIPRPQVPIPRPQVPIPRPQVPIPRPFSNVIWKACYNNFCLIHSKGCRHCGRLQYIQFACTGVEVMPFKPTVATVKTTKMSTSNGIHTTVGQTPGLTSTQRASKTSTIKIKLSSPKTSDSVWKTSQASRTSTVMIELSSSEASDSVWKTSEAGILAGSTLLVVSVLLIVIGRNRLHCSKRTKDIMRNPLATRSNPVYDFEPEIIQPNTVQIINVGEIAKRLSRKKNRCSYENTANFDQNCSATRLMKNQAEGPSYTVPGYDIYKEDGAYDHIKIAIANKICFPIDATYDVAYGRRNDYSDINSDFNLYDHTATSQIRSDTDEIYDHTFAPPNEDD